MTQEEAKEFIDNATYEDCAVQYNGAYFWCYGLVWWKEKGVFSMAVDKCRSLYPKWDLVESVLDVESPSREECMKHLLEDPIFDGKTFWQAAPEMKRW